MLIVSSPEDEVKSLFNRAGGLTRFNNNFVFHKVSNPTIPTILLVFHQFRNFTSSKLSCSHGLAVSWTHLTKKLVVLVQIHMGAIFIFIPTAPLSQVFSYVALSELIVRQINRIKMFMSAIFSFQQYFHLCIIGHSENKMSCNFLKAFLKRVQ